MCITSVTHVLMWVELLIIVCLFYVLKSILHFYHENWGYHLGNFSSSRFTFDIFMKEKIIYPWKYLCDICLEWKSTTGNSWFILLLIQWRPSIYFRVVNNVWFFSFNVKLIFKISEIKEKHLIWKIPHLRLSLRDFFYL